MPIQVTTGKFFSPSIPLREEKRFGIAHSNFAWIGPIETALGDLEPVSRFGTPTNSWVFRYVNRVPDIRRPGSIAAQDDSWIRKQFRIIASFGLHAYFSRDAIEVEKLCRKRRADEEDVAGGATFAEPFLRPSVLSSTAEVVRFQDFVAQLAGLRRSDFEVVMRALETFIEALRRLPTWPDQSYSLLVFSLEALTQHFDSFVPIWDDYPDKVRGPLDAVLEGTSQSIAEEVRSALLRSADLRAGVRFTAFVAKHLDPVYYLGPGLPLRPSDLRRALRNAYFIRSGFAHELQPMMRQLTSGRLGAGHSFRWDNEVYLTIPGLVAVAHRVIWSFVYSRPTVESEEGINWHSAHSGLLTLKAAPKYVVWKSQGFKPDHAPRWLGQYLSFYLDVSEGQERMCDMSELLSKFPSLFGRRKNTDAERRALLVGFVLWHYEWGDSVVAFKAIRDHNQVFSACSVEMMVLHLLLFSKLPWTLDACLSALAEYDSRRHHHGTLEVPQRFEVALLAETANLALGENDFESGTELHGKAMLEAAGYPKIQVLLAGSLRRGRPAMWPRFFSVPQMGTDKDFLTSADVAAALGISPASARRLAKKGALKATRVRGRWHFEPTDIVRRKEFLSLGAERDSTW